MVTAAPQDQWRLLDVAGHDTRLAQLAHRARSLPEHAELQAIEARSATMHDGLVAARTLAGDVQRELTRAEADVELVRQRAARDQARLDSGQGSAKDLTALQHELATLAQRQSVLEDVELEVMERLETAQAEVARLESEDAALRAEREAVVERRDAALRAVGDETQEVERARENAAAGLPSALLALYDRIREQTGTGAARLTGRRCEACRMELTPVAVGRIKASPEDAVLRCEECDRILVRPADSTL